MVIGRTCARTTGRVRYLKLRGSEKQMPEKGSHTLPICMTFMHSHASIFDVYAVRVNGKLKNTLT